MASWLSVPHERNGPCLVGVGSLSERTQQQIGDMSCTFLSQLASVVELHSSHFPTDSLACNSLLETETECNKNM
jgi:hypothetical protein